MTEIDNISGLSLNALMSSFPEQTYIRTLVKKYGCNTVGDVFSDSLEECKKLRELRRFILANVDVIEEPLDSAVVLGTGCSTPQDAFIQFISEYASRIKSDNGKKAFTMTYIAPRTIAAKPVDRKDIAKICGLTSERVRQILAAEVSACKSLLKGGAAGGMTADKSLCDWFAEVESNVKSVVFMDELRRISGIGPEDPYTQKLLCELLGLSVSTDENLKGVATRGCLKDFVREIGTVRKYFRDMAIPVTEQEFNDFLAISFSDASVRERLHDFVFSSSEYIITTDAEGTTTIALKWEYLEFLPSEIARILYDNKIFEVKDSWSKDQIVNSYNGLAKLYGKETIDRNVPNLFKHSLVIPLGKSGKYKIAKRAGEKFLSGQDFAKQYVIDHGKSSDAADFKQECDRLGYTDVYGDRSMSSYFYAAFNSLLAASGTANESYIPIEKTVEAAAYALLSCKEPITVSELNRKAESVLGRDIPSASLAQALAKASDLFDVTRPKPRHTLVELKVKSLEGIDFNKYSADTKGRKQAPYWQLLVDTAVDELRQAPGHRMPLADLVAKLKKLIPADLAPNNVYKIFPCDGLIKKIPTVHNRYDVMLDPAAYKEEYVDKATPAEVAPAKSDKDEVKPYSWETLRGILCAQYRYLENIGIKHIETAVDKMYEIMKDGFATMKDDSEFRKILSLLHQLYTTATSPNDRELLCVKAILGMEPYLKNLYRLSMGRELVCEGLGTAVKTLQYCGTLPDGNAYDKLGGEIYDKTGRIINKRNNLHENFEGATSYAMINYNTDLFLKYYIMVAAYNAK